MNTESNEVWITAYREVSIKEMTKGMKIQRDKDALEWSKRTGHSSWGYKMYDRVSIRITVY